MAPLETIRTLHDLHTQIQDQELENKKTVEETEKIKNEIGNNIERLFHAVVDSIKVVHHDLPAAEFDTLSAVKKFTHSLHKIWAVVANACIRKFIRLTFYLLGVKQKIKTTSHTFNVNIKKLQQDKFFLALGNFAAKELN